MAYASNDFSDLFNLEDPNTSDKLDEFSSPVTRPARPSAIGRLSPPGKMANFLVKLYMALQEEPPTTAVYWSADGRQLVVASPSQLEKNLLPRYWKHNKFSSFGRQLNIYGFSRVYPGRQFKDENGNIRDDASVWSHPTLHRESTLEEIMSIKRRAAPKLFRTRKLPNGQTMQVRAGSQVIARFNDLRAEKQDRFTYKAAEPYPTSSYLTSKKSAAAWNPSSAIRIKDEPDSGHSADWRLGAFPIQSPEQSTDQFSYDQEVRGVSSSTSYMPEAAEHSQYAEFARDGDEAEMLIATSNDRTLLSPIDIIQAIPHCTPRRASASTGKWMNGEMKPCGIRLQDLQALHGQGIPQMSWTTPSTPTGALAFRERWNSTASDPTVFSPHVYQQEHRNGFSYTAPVSPLHGTQPLTSGMYDGKQISAGYPQTPEDEKLVPRFYHSNQISPDYLFSQEHHAVPFSAVVTSQPSFEHVDFRAPASVSAHIQSEREEEKLAPVYEDIWPANVMASMATKATKEFPLPSNSPTWSNNIKEPASLPYASTYQYNTPSVAPGVFSDLQGPGAPAY
ncbi:hypothetical protein QFC19_009046 [Naganishia cerealis]|uniref:Uncharacterized protein n=1 Tax=Naganishia cerealis TaxID=610337 RepID=A0ACC2UY43_9TREE|nr:hypothetical protein QFC19_009046 [Naganishia cerealis]